MTREEREKAIKELQQIVESAEWVDSSTADEVSVDSIKCAIEALEFLEKYDAVWNGIKCAGEHGQEVELHRYGRVYRIREVAT